MDVQAETTAQRRTRRMLFKLGFPGHRIGYSQLCIAVPRFAEYRTQSFTKELYPYVAKQLGCASWTAVERSIREAIQDAWINGDPAVWKRYFPNCRKAPTNKQFISALAELLKD